MGSSLPMIDEPEKQQAFNRQTLIFFVIAAALALVLVMRLLYLQVWQYEKYRTRSEENRMEMVPVPPSRGMIFDRSGIPLAENRLIFNLALVPERIEDLDQFISRLSAIVSISEAEVQGFHRRAKRARRPFAPVVLKDALDEEQIATLAANAHLLIGMEINAHSARHYPYGPLTAHAVGSVRRITEEDLRLLDGIRYTGTNFIGKRGLEKVYEEALLGGVGSQWVETDAFGRQRRVLQFNPPSAGQNITLHLDLRVQIAAAAALGARRGAVVAMDPKSGGVLALVSNPGYDPNEFVLGMSPERFRTLVRAKDTPLLNRAVNGQYAPGSIIKPALGLAALSAGLLNWEDEFVDPGFFRLPGQKRVYRDWNWTPENSGGQGVANLNRAIYRSSNVFFYNIGARLDVQQMAGFMRQFGYGSVRSMDVANASAGLVPDPVWKQGAKGEPWYPGDNINMSIGQGDLLVTPLQAATAAAVLANRGRLVRPRMLMASDRPLLDVKVREQPSWVSGPSRDDWERMVDAMEDVVHRGAMGSGQNGTAWYYIGRGIGYRMAGKSGTAQVVEINQGQEYNEDALDEYNRNHAWFIAFAPADDPAIAVSVLVENGGGGSAVAAPVAREVLDAYLLPQLAVR